MSINFILVGKTGLGKSSTGNSILGRKEFPVSSGTRSKTKEVKVAWAEHGLYDIKVVDGPGLADTDLSQTEDKQTACENMAKALLMCNGGVHAFVLVLKFPMKFTSEERKALSDLKQIFGENYLKEHGIIVVTGGDQFLEEMKEKGTPSKSFREWCREENQDVFKECSWRIVLFNNRTPAEEGKQNQRNELLQHAERLSKEKGLYTSEHFELYAELRAKMVQQHNLPLLRENIQRQLSLLTADLELLSVNSTLKDVGLLKKRVDDLFEETGTLCQTETSLQPAFDHLKTMKRLTHELERAIKEKSAAAIESHVGGLKNVWRMLEKIMEIPWVEFISSIGKIAGVILLGTAAVAGAVVVGAVAVSAAVPATTFTAVLSLASVLFQIAKFFLYD